MSRRSPQITRHRHDCRITESNPSPALCEEQLIQVAKAGNPEAFGKLYIHHRLALRKVALSILGNDADAEDAVQEGLLRAYEHLETFRGESAFKTWLVKVVANAARQLRRQKSRQPVIMDDFMACCPTTGTQKPLDKLVQDELLEQVNRLLQQQASWKQEIVRLRFQEDQTYHEIAQRIGGVTKESARFTIYQLRKDFQDDLTQQK